MEVLALPCKEPNLHNLGKHYMVCLCTMLDCSTKYDRNHALVYVKLQV